jgi:hypothetical protein
MQISFFSIKRKKKILDKNRLKRWYFCKVVSGLDHFCQTDCYWTQIWIQNMCSTENKQKKREKILLLLNCSYYFAWLPLGEVKKQYAQ